MKTLKPKIAAKAFNFNLQDLRVGQSGAVSGLDSHELALDKGMARKTGSTLTISKINASNKIESVVLSPVEIKSLIAFV
jgi:hypothetical protein